MVTGPELAPMILALTGAFTYITTSGIAPKYFLGTRLDKKIPLLPIFVVPYLFIFPYGIATVAALWHTPFIDPFLIASAAAGWAAGLIWYVMPAAMHRPKIIKNDVLSSLVGFIYSLDPKANTFPSAHVFYTLICSYFLWLAFPEYLAVFATISTLIVLSTLFIRQHHLADVAAGIVWAVSAISAAQSLWA